MSLALLLLYCQVVNSFHIANATVVTSSTESCLYTIPKHDPAPVVFRNGRQSWYKLDIPEGQTMFARFLLWHGRLPGWPALRIVCEPWKKSFDCTWRSDDSNKSTRSVIHTVMKAINLQVGILANADPTDSQIAAASAYISQLERNVGTSLTALYKVLKKPRAARREPSSDSDDSDADATF